MAAASAAVITTREDATCRLRVSFDVPLAERRQCFQVQQSSQAPQRIGVVDKNRRISLLTATFNRSEAVPKAQAKRAGGLSDSGELVVSIAGQQSASQAHAHRDEVAPVFPAIVHPAESSPLPPPSAQASALQSRSSVQIGASQGLIGYSLSSGASHVTVRSASGGSSAGFQPPRLARSSSALRVTPVRFQQQSPVPAAPHAVIGISTSPHLN